jgi:hypothetical protein
MPLRALRILIILLLISPSFTYELSLEQTAEKFPLKISADFITPQYLLGYHEIG